MNFNEIRSMEERYYARTFSRLPVAIVKGKGMYLYNEVGERFLDMFAGIAVNSLGHAHPEVIKTIKEQSEKLMHVSNWCYTLPQLELSKLLTEITGMEKAFITNSGTESVESAIKLARRATKKKEIIAMENAFHGRTLGALSITWDEKYRKPFQPLVPGMRFVPYNDTDAIRNKIGDNTAAVILEPILGESGVIIPDKEYLKELREITLEEDVLLIIDEIQTGFGRTGKMFEFQHSGIKPDILCLAKGMGGGFPIGAILFTGIDFEPGEHGGTFVGNPLACSVAKRVIEIIQRENLVENSRKIGRYILKNLEVGGANVRGKGLMMGVDVDDGRRVVLELIEQGVLTIYSGNTVRVLPPLIIERKHADHFLAVWDNL